MKRKHLLGLHGVSREEIEKILNQAAFMKKVLRFSMKIVRAHG